MSDAARLNIITAGATFEAAEPLYRRVPTQDADGSYYADFMVLIPGLRDMQRASLDERIAAIQSVLGAFREIVFADLNLRINLLWVSFRQRRGLITELMGRLHVRVPEARLVALDPGIFRQKKR